MSRSDPFVRLDPSPFDLDAAVIEREVEPLPFDLGSRRQAVFMHENGSAYRRLVYDDGTIPGEQGEPVDPSALQWFAGYEETK